MASVWVEIRTETFRLHVNIVTNTQAYLVNLKNEYPAVSMLLFIRFHEFINEGL
jgi:hypothetical protein